MTEPAARPSALPPVRRRWLRALALALLTLVLLAGVAAWWLLGTNAGLRFALARAIGATGGALSVGRAEGRLAGPLSVSDLRYRDASGLDVQLGRAHVDFAVWPLLDRRLHIRELDADGIAVTLPRPSTGPETASGPIDLQPPLDIAVDRAHIGRVRIVQSDGTGVFASDTADLAGRWTADGLVLHRLDLAGPSGSAGLRGDVAIGAGYRGDGEGRFDWRVGEQRYTGTLAAHGDGRQATLDLRLSRPLGAQLRLAISQAEHEPWNATLEVPAADPTPLLGEGGAIHTLAASIQASGDNRGGRMDGRVQLNGNAFDLRPLRAHFSDDFSTLQLEQLALTSPQIPGSLEASGLVQLDGAAPSADLELQWKGVVLPAELAGQALASEGRLQFKGSAATYHAAGTVTVGPPGQPSRLQLDLDGTPGQVALHTLALEQGKGGLDASGTVVLQPALAWDLQVQAHAFDPGQIFAGWRGAVDADLGTRGTRGAAGLDATLDLRRLGGTLRQRALRGQGKVHLSPSQVIDGTLDLASGSSHIRAVAKPGARNDAELTLAIASLGDWLPDAGGRLDGHFAVRGLAPKLSVNGTLRGERLAWQAQKLDRLDLVVGVPDISQPSGKLDVDGRGLFAGGLAFDRLHLLAEGSQSKHRLTLDARGRQLSATVALDGSLAGGDWNGSLQALDLEPQGLPAWRLQRATGLAYRKGALRVDELCLTAGDPLLCASANRDATGNLDASYRLRALPLALVLNAAGMADLPIRADGSIEGDGRIRRSAAGALGGNASIRSVSGTVSYTDHADQPLVAYRNLALQAELAADGQRATMHADFDDGGRLDGQLAIRGASQALSGSVDLSLKRLAFVELLTSEVANVKGTLDGRFVIGGTLAQPALSGNAQLRGFAAEVPVAGLKLTDGHVTLATNDSRTFRIDGQLTSGKGTLAIGGSAGLGGPDTSLTLKGSQVTAADIPAARVVMSPDLVIHQGPQGVDITGRVALDSADVDVSRLPGAGATRASPDVVVVDEAQQEAKAQAMPISATVSVDLGRRTHLVGLGLDGRLQGQLVVKERPGRSTTGQGQVDVSGTYRAYGQNLTIEQGRLLFASTPVDNPRLDIRAVRKLNPNATIDEGQKVGLNVSGTAQRPVLTVFSQPVMEQSDALSYLITGKPLSEVKGGEGSMVNSAAQALGSAGGDLLAKRIGSRLGVDDIGVSSSDALNGSSAFTVGKYLSPRLYLSYGVGLFDPGQVITLRYRLSKRWNFEAQNATDFSRASFNYRLEK